GFSMHPLEHLIYLSNVLIHILFASHPVHIFFHLQWNAIGAGTSHSGYESLTVRGKPVIDLSPFHHQLHHRLYNCNYGNSLVPMDKLFGSDHDGTDEAWSAIRNGRRVRVAEV
ncbi:MAG TPA: sterol desaturase family protein, partial [Gammaproteobacteria bacterium]|nr:sterol desaturase family protein [Gammaproteobacteria bacterium]